MEHVGKRIRAIRDERGLKQQALARFAGLSQNSLYMIEHGRRDPSLATLERLAEALNVSPAEFFPPVGKGQSAPSGPSSGRLLKGEEEKRRELGRFVQRVIERTPTRSGQPPLEEQSDEEIAAHKQAAERATKTGIGVGDAYFAGDTGEEVRLSVSHEPGEPLTVENMYILARRVEELEEEVNELRAQLREYAGR
jgi:transcriptional regulator with XRE-family HTH domain